jgi:MFS family permease
MSISSRLLLAAAASATVAVALAERIGDPMALAAGAVFASLLVPALWVTAALQREDLQWKAIAAGIALALSGLVAGGTLAMGLAVQSAAGLAGGLLLARQWRWLPLVAVVSAVLAPGVALSLGGASFADLAAEQVALWREQYLVQLPPDLSEADRAATLARFDDLTAGYQTVMRRLWPSLVLIGLAGQAAILLALGWGLARMTGTAPPRRPAEPLVAWKAPFGAVWVLIGGLALSLAGRGGVADLGWNLVTVAGALVTLQGFAVEAWTIRRVLPPAAQTMFWVVGAFFFAPILVSAGALLGLADQWMDLRRLRRQPDDNET